MSCGASCVPSANFPDPNNRFGGPPRALNSASRDRQPRRQRFFSRRLQRVSDIAHEPTSIRFRELVLLVFVLFASYKGYFVADRIYEALARRDVGRVCNGTTAMRCLQYHLWLCSWMWIGWLGEIVPWGVVGVVGVFLGEELLLKTRRFLKK
ncbi:hypothetical protein SPI_08333 [Niveomyces insectorum RCEF 264]|uniref:Uncharacterized protein n=1 Tax=Niveomyces insectorum RCEF 264 TaxID=1081102 RepID=A0A167N7Z7_9HYPO|nr:hypothetical protein SPI_08333 [Niveomyces insectorum RCEF 264]